MTEPAINVDSGLTSAGKMGSSIAHVAAVAGLAGCGKTLPQIGSDLIL